MQIAHVLSDGLHLRNRPHKYAETVTLLASGDAIAVEESTKPVSGWMYGRVNKIANHVNEDERTKLWGWFYSVGTVRIETIAPPPPKPKPVDPQPPLSPWPDDEEKESHPWIWIVGGVLAAIGIIGSIYFIR
jgi:hypothetical protein